MFEGLTEEQTSRVRFGVLAARDVVIHIRRPATLLGRADQTLQAAESIDKARRYWAPGSFWGLRYPRERDGI